MKKISISLSIAVLILLGLYTYFYQKRESECLKKIDYSGSAYFISGISSFSNPKIFKTQTDAMEYCMKT